MVSTAGREIIRGDMIAHDGVRIAVHEMGEGRPLILVHGLFSSAQVNWIKYGHADLLAEAGFRVIMPDLRAHGDSDAPHDPDAYPADILAQDMRTLIAGYGLEDYDIAGFSLGARTVAALLAQGLTPRRAILAGMGLEGLNQWLDRRQFFIDAIDRAETVTRDDPHFMAVMFMRTMKIDPVAARLLLQSPAQVDMAALVALPMPIGVICGDQDMDNGSAPALARQLADGRYIEIPGTHMSCITGPALGVAMRDFLTGAD